MGKGKEVASNAASIAIPLAASAIGMSLGGPQGALKGFQIGRSITGAGGGGGGEASGGTSIAQPMSLGSGFPMLSQRNQAPLGLGGMRRAQPLNLMSIFPQTQQMSDFELRARNLLLGRGV